jgi:glycine cleavage system H protein
MDTGRPKSLHYKKSHFVTQLPEEYLYSPSHYWLSRTDVSGVWQVGFTKFAVRMLGELVDFSFDLPVGSSIEPGSILGWIEGFKAMTDLYSAGTGTFIEPNPQLKEKLALVHKEPYTLGWLYRFQGEPDARCFGVQQYITFLDKTIDKILEKQGSEEVT